MASLSSSFRFAVSKTTILRPACTYARTTTTTRSTASSWLGAVCATSVRSYISRAHPQPSPVFAVNEALDDLLKDISQRRRRRQRKWVRNATTPDEIKDKKHPDETIELSINLNLDPRKPGQALRGSISLPNGTGKTFNCIVFTDDEELTEAALKAGAKHAGGTWLMDALLSGEVPVDSLDRSLATTDMMTPLSKKVARLLGPRGLMPNAKTGTLVPPDDLIAALATQVAGKEVQYRTEREGVVHVPVGKASFGAPKLLENIGAVMQEIYAVKPEQYGKGKKKNVGKAAKYLLKAYLSSTQSPSFGLDPRTVDPNSPFFLTSVETGPKDDSTSEPSPEQAAA